MDTEQARDANAVRVRVAVPGPSGQWVEVDHYVTREYMARFSLADAVDTADRRARGPRHRATRDHLLDAALRVFGWEARHAASILGLPVIMDPEMPVDEVSLRDHQRKEVARFTLGGEHSDGSTSPVDTPRQPD